MRKPSTSEELRGAYPSRMQTSVISNSLLKLRSFPSSVLTCVQVVIAPSGLIVPESAFQKRL